MQKSKHKIQMKRKNQLPEKVRKRLFEIEKHSNTRFFEDKRRMCEILYFAKTANDIDSFSYLDARRLFHTGKIVFNELLSPEISEAFYFKMFEK